MKTNLSFSTTTRLASHVKPDSGATAEGGQSVSSAGSSELRSTVYLGGAEVAPVPSVGTTHRYFFRARRGLQLLDADMDICSDHVREAREIVFAAEEAIPVSVNRWPGIAVTCTADDRVAIEWNQDGGFFSAFRVEDGWRIVGDARGASRRSGLTKNEVLKLIVSVLKS